MHIGLNHYFISVIATSPPDVDVAAIEVPLNPFSLKYKSFRRKCRSKFKLQTKLKVNTCKSEATNLALNNWEWQPVKLSLKCCQNKTNFVTLRL